MLPRFATIPMPALATCKSPSRIEIGPLCIVNWTAETAQKGGGAQGQGRPGSGPRFAFAFKLKFAWMKSKSEFCDIPPWQK